MELYVYLCEMDNISVDLYYIRMLSSLNLNSIHDESESLVTGEQ